MRVALALTCAGALVTAAAPATAHIVKRSGPYVLTVGWGNEPVYAGFENFVDVAVADRRGAPVARLGDGLSVEVSFGETRVVRPLEPAEQPGRLRAPLLPTRPGTYTFHVSGTIRGHAIDTETTCSSATFECVADAGEIAFPAKDPSNGELAARLSRALPRSDDGGGGQGLAIAALVVAAAALVVAGLGLRRR